MIQQNLSCSLCGEPRVEPGCNLNGWNIDDAQTRKLTQRYERGQIVFLEGTPAEAAFSIQSGRVKLYQSNGNGQKQVIRLLVSGDIIGLQELLGQRNHSLTAEAIEPTAICVVPRKLALERFELTEDQASKLMNKLGAELRVSQEQMVSLLSRSVRQRTARLLLSLYDQSVEGADNKPRRLTRLARTEMAQIIGTTPESMSRTIHSMAEQKLIEATRTHIVLLDYEGMKEVAESQ